MYLITKGYTFWNADQDCFTEARQAATEYETLDDLPQEIDGLELYNDSPLCSPVSADEVWYALGDEDPVAWVKEI